jgi:hypothetical protein
MDELEERLGLFVYRLVVHQEGEAAECSLPMKIFCAAVRCFIRFSS